MEKESYLSIKRERERNRGEIERQREGKMKDI